MLLVSCLIKALLPQLFSLNRGPPGGFKLLPGYTYIAALLGALNTFKMFLCPCPHLLLATKFYCGGLQRVFWTLWLGLCPKMKCQLWDHGYTCVFPCLVQEYCTYYQDKLT